MNELSGTDGGYLIEPAKQAETEREALRALGKPLAASIMEAARKKREKDIPGGLMTWPGEELSVGIDVGSSDKTVVIVGVGDRMHRRVLDMIVVDEITDREAWRKVEASIDADVFKALSVGEIGTYEGFKIVESHDFGRAPKIERKEKPYYRRFERHRRPR